MVVEASPVAKILSLKITFGGASHVLFPRVASNFLLSNPRSSDKHINATFSSQARISCAWRQG